MRRKVIEYLCLLVAWIPFSMLVGTTIDWTMQRWSGSFWSDIVSVLVYLMFMVVSFIFWFRMVKARYWKILTASGE